MLHQLIPHPSDTALHCRNSSNLRTPPSRNALIINLLSQFCRREDKYTKISTKISDIRFKQRNHICINIFCVILLEGYGQQVAIKGELCALTARQHRKQGLSTLTKHRFQLLLAASCHLPSSKSNSLSRPCVCFSCLRGGRKWSICRQIHIIHKNAVPPSLECCRQHLLLRSAQFRWVIRIKSVLVLYKSAQNVSYQWTQTLSNW